MLVRIDAIRAVRIEHVVIVEMPRVSSLGALAAFFRDLVGVLRF